MKNNKNYFREKVDFAIRVISCLLTLGAVIIGGFWTYHQYTLSGEDGWTINLSIQTEVLPYHDDLRMLVVNLVSKNPRPYVNEISDKNKDSFKLYFREIQKDLTDGSIIDDDKIKDIQTVDILKDAGGDYAFFPSSELNETRTLIVHKDKVISVTAKIMDGTPDEWYVSATKIVKID